GNPSVISHRSRVPPFIVLNLRESVTWDCSECEKRDIRQKRHFQRNLRSVKKSAKMLSRLNGMLRTEDPEGFEQKCYQSKRRKKEEPSRKTMQLNEQTNILSDTEYPSSSKFLSLYILFQNWCIRPSASFGNMPSCKLKLIRARKLSSNNQEIDQNLRRTKRCRKRPEDRTESTDAVELFRSPAPSPTNERVKLKHTGKRKKSAKRAIDLTESEYIPEPSTNLPNDEMVGNKKREANVKNKRQKTSKKSRKISAEADQSSNRETYRPESSTSTPIIRSVTQEEVNQSLISGKSLKKVFKIPPGLTAYDLKRSPNLPPQNESALIENLKEKQNSGEIRIEDTVPTCASMDIPDQSTPLPAIESVLIENFEGNQKSRGNSVEDTESTYITMDVPEQPTSLPIIEKVQLEKPKTQTEMIDLTTTWIGISGPSTSKINENMRDENLNRSQKSKAKAKAHVSENITANLLKRSTSLSTKTRARQKTMENCQISGEALVKAAESSNIFCEMSFDIPGSPATPINGTAQQKNLKGKAKYRKATKAIQSSSRAIDTPRTPALFAVKGKNLDENMKRIKERLNRYQKEKIAKTNDEMSESPDIMIIKEFIWSRSPNKPEVESNVSTGTSLDTPKPSTPLQREGSHSERVAEKVDGMITQNGKNYLVVKWFNIETPEHVEKSKATPRMLQLFSEYQLRQREFNLTAALEPKKQSIGNSRKTSGLGTGMKPNTDSVCIDENNNGCINDIKFLKLD
ncbi:hypothetical protein TNIN_402931, partial [Trichonephila inaurata madagascariensis]